MTPSCASISTNGYEALMDKFVLQVQHELVHQRLIQKPRAHP